MNRRLYRCRHDKRIAGVASGLAEYFDLDTSLVRVLWVVSIFFGGLGLLLYVAMAIIVPLEPEERPLQTAARPPTRRLKHRLPPPPGGTRGPWRSIGRAGATAGARRSSGSS